MCKTRNVYKIRNLHVNLVLRIWRILQISRILRKCKLGFVDFADITDIPENLM